jgi:hypothetical protein
MSKMDGLRAMREARHAEMQKRAGAATKKTPARPPVAPPAASAATCQAAPVTSASVEADADELCGHRNMSGRSCTRERGHAAKSHRYS